ncbi:hypothetical protein TNCV_4191141 [Trichonephila clavipes]|nr:hypothetical protein TNCV_4191141 [Trichonephila clavipes]
MFNVSPIHHRHTLSQQASSSQTLFSESEVIFATAASILYLMSGRDIAARVIERDTSGEIYYFLEDSRGFRPRQHGRQCRQNGRQSRQLGSTAKISPSSH